MADCPRLPVLRFSVLAIIAAFYAVMLELCEDRQGCTVKASPETFTQDPCVGTSKYLDVHYKCRPNEFEQGTACEGDELEIWCEKGDRIAIYSAMFGRTPNGSDVCPPNKQGYIDCVAADTVSEVRTRCHGRKSCALLANESIFGDPCAAGINKYLSVSYACVPKKILKQLHRKSNKRKKKRKKKKKKNKGRGNVTRETTEAPLEDERTSESVPKAPDREYGTFVEQPSVTRIIPEQTTSEQEPFKGGVHPLFPGQENPLEAAADDITTVQDSPENISQASDVSTELPVVTTMTLLETSETQNQNQVIGTHGSNPPDSEDQIRDVSSEPDNEFMEENRSAVENIHTSTEAVYPGEFIHPDVRAEDSYPESSSEIPDGLGINTNNNNINNNNISGRNQVGRISVDSTDAPPSNIDTFPNTRDSYPLNQGNENGDLVSRRENDNKNGDPSEVRKANSAKENVSKGSGEKDSESKSQYVTERNLTVLCINYTKPDVRWRGLERPRDERSIGFLRDWFSVWHFLHNNEEKAWLYFTLGMCGGIIIMLVVILVKVCINFRRNIRARLDVSEPTHRNAYTSNNHSSLEAPMLEHSDSIDRIEVVRFSPRSTLRSVRSNSNNRDIVNYYG